MITVPGELGFTAAEGLVQRLPGGQLFVTPADMVDAPVLAEAAESLERAPAGILKLPDRRTPKS